MHLTFSNHLEQGLATTRSSGGEHVHGHQTDALPIHLKAEETEIVLKASLLNLIQLLQNNVSHIQNW